MTTIGAVATKGRGNSAQWTKTYNLAFSSNGTDWTDYEEDGSVRIFTGNIDQNTAVTQALASSVSTRYVRFKPLTWQGATNLRVEVYPVSDVCLFDDDAQVGIDSINSCFQSGHGVIVKTSSDGNSTGSITVAEPFSWADHSLSLLADHDISLQAELSATGTANLQMSANRNGANDDDLFVQPGSVDLARSALQSIGRIRVPVTDSGFAGSVNFNSTGSLLLNGDSYTVVHDLAELRAMTLTAGARYALGNDIDTRPVMRLIPLSL